MRRRWPTGGALRTLVGGMCETDYSGYPDCRNDTLQTLAKAISLGMDAPFAIETPLMWIDKAGTWAMAETLGGARLVDLIVEHTHTCYTPTARPGTPGATAAANAPRASCARKDGRNGKPARPDPRRRAGHRRRLEGAHKIVQEDEEDATSCWIHAVLHKIEGDAGNSRYWYRRAGQSYEAYPDAKAELAAIKAVLTY